MNKCSTYTVNTTVLAGGSDADGALGPLWPLALGGAALNATSAKGTVVVGGEGRGGARLQVFSEGLSFNDRTLILFPLRMALSAPAHQ